MRILIDALVATVFLAVIIALIAILLGCSPAHLTSDHMVDCENAEQDYELLGCYDQFVLASPAEMQSIDTDMAWIDYCVAVQDSGVVIVNTDCIIEAITCDEIGDCFE